jgi:O-antigen/teichoic acid export membrane protein
MIKTFFQNSFIYTIGNILVKGISLFLVPIYTRYLSPGEYGIIDLFSVIGSFISLTITLEISQAIARYYQDAKTLREKKEYTSTAFLFTVFMYIIYLIISFFFKENFTIWLLDDIKYLNVFLLASVDIATNGIFYFTQNQLKWQLKPKDSVMVSILNVVILASVTIYLLTIQETKIESIFIGQICGNVVSSIFAIYYARNSYSLIFDFNKLKIMISYSFPLVFSSISIFVSLYIDRIMIKEFLDFNELGIYGIAYRFASVVGILMIGFQQSLTPLIFKHYKRAVTPKQLSNIFNLFIVLALGIYLGSILFSKEIVILFTMPQYYNSANIIPFLVLILFINNIYIFFPGMDIAKKTKIIAILNFFGAILNTIMNLLLVKFGLYGIVFATLISSFIIFFIRVRLSNKYYYIPYDWKKIIFSFVFVTICGYFVECNFNYTNITDVSMKILFFIGIFSILSLSFLKKYVKKD